MEKTLQVLSNELYQKAEERGCNMICIVECEDRDGFNVVGCGDRLRIAEMIAEACKKSEMFLNVFDRAVLEISVRKIDDLLKNNNPLKTEKSN